MTRRWPLAALIAAEGLSAFGSQLSALALPWFVLITTGSPTRMGFVFAVELVPVAVLGLPSGGVIDRYGARRTMLVCDAARAPLIALVPLLHETGNLPFAALLVIVGLIGVFSTPYYTAQRLVIPQVVGTAEADVARGNSLVEGATNAASFLGPAAAGVLISLLGATSVLWLDAATFVASFVVVGVLVPAPFETPNVERPRRVLDGLRFIAHDSLVARAAASSLLFGFLFRLLFASFPVLAFERYHHDPRVAGWLAAAWGGGAVAGSVAAYKLLTRVRPLKMAALAAIGTALPLWLLVPNLGITVTAIGVALSSAAIPMINAPYLGMLSTRIPSHLQGRVLQSILTINNLAGPLGYAIAGPIFDYAGLEWSYALIAALATAAGANFLIVAGRSGFIAADHATVS